MKNPKKPKKTQKNPLGWVFLKKPGLSPTLTTTTATTITATAMTATATEITARTTAMVATQQQCLPQQLQLDQYTNLCCGSSGDETGCRMLDLHLVKENISVLIHSTSCLNNLSDGDVEYTFLKMKKKLFIPFRGYTFYKILWLFGGKIRI